MAVSQADIDRLNNAIAYGEKSVTLNGQTTVYRSVDDLIKARDDLLRQKAQEDADQGNKRVTKRTYAFYSGRGYN